jgi:hypothetical protein
VAVAPLLIVIQGLRGGYSPGCNDWEDWVEVAQEENKKGTKQHNTKQTVSLANL